MALFITDLPAEEKLATFLRIRPLNNVGLEDTPFSVLSANHLHVEIEKKAKTNQHKIFNFTEIFDANSSQGTVFSKCCSPLVNDVINGTNGFLFCFGTTSSGKSYTMRGPHEDPTADPGLIPLALKKIFKSRTFLDSPVIGKNKFNDISCLNEEQQDSILTFKDAILSSPVCRTVTSFVSCESNNNFNEDGYQYLCYLSYFEIYNNLIFDLLNSSGGRGQPLSLAVDEQSRYYVKDLSSVFVTNLSEALKIYSYGWTNLVRNIQKTGLNDNSSRSHSFFNITVIKFKEDNGSLLDSQVSHFTLGDLAGSERQSKTQAAGDRVKEGGNINVSLMHLKDCFNQTKLNQKNPNRNYVVPFRHCNLTKIFQPYLTGTGRVWMIVNINPSPALFQETLGSLDLCETASKISVNSTFQLKLEESKRRMTQMWLQSSKRWSSFENKYKVPDIPAQDIELVKAEREEQIRNEVIQQFEEILNELSKDHEQDIQATKDNYERTMEARLALSDRKYTVIINDMQENVDKLTNELFDARENIVHLEEQIAKHEKKFEEKHEKELNDVRAEYEHQLEKLREQLDQLEQPKDTSKLEVISINHETQTDEPEPQPITQLSDSETQTEEEEVKSDLELITCETQTDEEVKEPSVELAHIEIQTDEIKEPTIEAVDCEIQTDKEPIIEIISHEIQTDEIIAVDNQTQTEVEVVEVVEVEEDEEAEEEEDDDDDEDEEEEEEEEEEIQCTDSEDCGLWVSKTIEEVIEPVKEVFDREIQTEEEIKENFIVISHRETQTDAEEEFKIPPIESIDRETQTHQEEKKSASLSIPTQPPVQQELSIDCLEDILMSPRRSTTTRSNAACSTRKSEKPEIEKNFSVKKDREITIDTSYFPASVSKLTKKKQKEEANPSPSTEITNEYLRRFCPNTATKKSAKKSVKKPPRKSTKAAIVKEPENEESDIENDEIASLLMSQKKDNKKKKSKEAESAVKIPTKRKKLPAKDGLLEQSICTEFEDLPKSQEFEQDQEPNIKGGRVLRPRRRIKF